MQPVLRDHGLTLVDLEWRGHRPRGVLRVFVDKPGGVRVEDCQRASRELGDVLDAAGADRGGVRSGSVVAGAGPPAPEGPRAPVGDRQARALLAGRRRGAPRAPRRRRRRRADPGSGRGAGGAAAGPGHEGPAGRGGALAATAVRDYEPRTDHRHRAARAARRGSTRRSSSRRWSLPCCRPRGRPLPRRQHADPDRPQDRRDARLRPQEGRRRGHRSQARDQPRRGQGAESGRPSSTTSWSWSRSGRPRTSAASPPRRAKQVILQKVRDAEREGIYSEFAGKEGQILRGGRAPHREAQRDPRDRQGRGDPARARADPGRALQPRRPHPRLRARGAPHGQGAADHAVADAPRLPRAAVRDRDPRDPGGDRGRQGHRARGGRAGQGGGGVDQARRRSRSAPAWGCAARASR